MIVSVAAEQQRGEGGKVEKFSQLCAALASIWWAAPYNAMKSSPLLLYVLLLLSIDTKTYTAGEKAQAYRIDIWSFHTFHSLSHFPRRFRNWNSTLLHSAGTHVEPTHPMRKREILIKNYKSPSIATLCESQHNARAKWRESWTVNKKRGGSGSRMRINWMEHVVQHITNIKT